jgi:hypothetical protein
MNKCIVCGGMSGHFLLLCDLEGTDVITHLVCSDACEGMFRLNPLVYEHKGEKASREIGALVKKLMAERK